MTKELILDINLLNILDCDRKRLARDLKETQLSLSHRSGVRTLASFVNGADR